MLGLDLSDLVSAGKQAKAKKAKQKKSGKRTAAYIEVMHKGSYDIESIQAAEAWTATAYVINTTTTHNTCCDTIHHRTSSSPMVKFEHKTNGSIVYRKMPANMFREGLPREVIWHDETVAECYECFMKDEDKDNG